MCGLGARVGRECEDFGARISAYFQVDVLVAIDDFWRQLAEKPVS